MPARALRRLLQFPGARAVAVVATSTAGPGFRVERSFCESHPHVDDRDRSAGMVTPGRCTARPSKLGGRGLFAAQRFEAGDEIFREVAVLDSIASPSVRTWVFAQAPHAGSGGAEPIWGLVANFVAAHCASADVNSAKTIEALSNFFRPCIDARSQELYGAHAKQIHAALSVEASSLMPVQKLQDLLLSVRINAHNIIVHERFEGREQRVGNTTRIGLGLFFWLHLANHSCHPNAFFSAKCDSASDGKAKMTLYALRPVNIGEEICISYVDGHTLLASRATRQRRLQHHFGFYCECERCGREALGQHT